MNQLSPRPEGFPVTHRGRNESPRPSSSSCWIQHINSKALTFPGSLASGRRAVCPTGADGFPDSLPGLPSLASFPPAGALQPVLHLCSSILPLPATLLTRGLDLALTQDLSRACPCLSPHTAQIPRPRQDSSAQQNAVCWAVVGAETPETLRRRLLDQRPTQNRCLSICILEYLGSV